MLKLSNNDFKFIVKSTALFAIDIIITDSNDFILIGFRNNSPAKNCWFVPGGRVFKNESLNSALARILRDEVGLVISGNSTKLIGIFEHFYSDSPFDDYFDGTHYIVGAIKLTLNMPFEECILLKDEQHKSLKFLKISELLDDPFVHEYTKAYFKTNAENKFILL